MANWLTDARTLASPAIVILMVGNKTDLEEEREVTFLEASRLMILIIFSIEISLPHSPFLLQVCPRKWFDVLGDLG